MPGCKLHISSTVRIIILDLLGRTSVEALLPARRCQEQQERTTVGEKPPVEKPCLPPLWTWVDGEAAWVPEEGSARGDGEPLGDGPAAAVSGAALREAVLQRSPVVLTQNGCCQSIAPEL